MFVLCQMCDTVRIAAHALAVPTRIAIEHTLNRKLANKVVLDVGLCLCVYDIEKVVDSYILPGDAGSHTKVHFRVCALRPFIGEVCCARIRANTRHGLYLTLKFFDDIFVPADKLPTPSVFDETEQVWYWQYSQDSDEATDADEKVQLFMDVGKLVRFRVVDEKFTDLNPHKVHKSTTQQIDVKQEPGTVDARDAADDAASKVAYMITATMAEAGLGCLEWWAPTETADDDAQ